MVMPVRILPLSSSTLMSLRDTCLLFSKACALYSRSKFFRLI